MWNASGGGVTGMRIGDEGGSLWSDVRVKKSLVRRRS